MFVEILNYLLNRLPFIKAIDGYKTKIAGILIALAGIIVAVTPLIPAPYDTFAMAVAEFVRQVSEVLGTLGVAGMLAKKWDVPKLPSKPDAPELVK